METESTFSPPAVAAAAAQRAIARLLRGTTWQAITREIAWHAATSVDGGYELAERLVGVVDEVLSELIDGIECRVDSAVVAAYDSHLEWRPHDAAGAELVAEIAGAEEAERLVLAAYDGAREYAEAAAQARRQAADERERAPRRRSLFRRSREKKVAPLPEIDLGDLGQSTERYGWPRKDAA